MKEIFLSLLLIIYIDVTNCSASFETIDISWILISRNDDYCGNPMERLKTTLNHLFKKLDQYGLQKSNEVILVDWNSQVPIVHNPEIDGWLKETKYDLKLLKISPEIARKITDSKLSEVHGLNAAARRANGHFIIRIDQDCIVGDPIFEFITNNCKRDRGFYDKVWWCGRRETPRNYYDFFIENAEQFLRKNSKIGITLKCPVSSFVDLYGAGYVGIMGIPKEIWLKNRGYNEEFVYYGGMERELFYRLKKNGVPMVLLNEYVTVKNPVYHIWHERYDKKRKGKRNRNIFKIDKQNDIYDVKPNDDNWGLQNFDLKVIDAQEYI